MRKKRREEMRRKREIEWRVEMVVGGREMRGEKKIRDEGGRGRSRSRKASRGSGGGVPAIRISGGEGSGGAHDSGNGKRHDSSSGE